MKNSARFVSILAVLIGMAGLTACSEAGLSDSEASLKRDEGNAAKQKAEAPVTPAEKTDPVALTETDRIMLDQAESACIFYLTDRYRDGYAVSGSLQLPVSDARL